VAAIEFRLLGPLEVWRGGQRVAVGGAKPRALLAMLLVHPNEAVGTDRLIDALWGERPPATAPNALQAHVAALRRVLDPNRAMAGEDDVLVTRRPGYLLRVADDELDVTRFERLVAEGRDALPSDPANAAGLLGDALGLWHGPALAEFVFEPFAQAEAARLEELRLAALEDRIKAELAVGRHAEVTPELEALVAEHPLRERLAGQLMLALYRSGRQADASRVYHATRAMLVEELGMEPGPSMRQLHKHVLDQHPTLELPEPAVSAGAPQAARSPAPGRAAHNLPVELTSFVGREHELEEVCSLLRNARLLTLTGTGGAGKTRLGLRAARQVLGDYPDGVWLVELAALADPSLVDKAVAAALGVSEESGPVIETLQTGLRSARLLVVLDNCEHVIQAAAELAHRLLSTCEGLRILATSREPLNTAGELIWPVPGLALPDTPTLPPLDQLSAYAAIRLFAERAAAGRPDFVLGSDNGEVVTRLCRRLDGIPLAIELAAARVRVISPHEILQRLDDRFGLLTGGNRDAIPRQQTLWATLEWSHDLLDGSERILFRRLAVFAGGWSITDADQVCADEQLPAATIFEALCQLAAKSLVVAEPAAVESSRYRLLETLRYYATERLAAANEHQAIRRRHFNHFLGLAERAHVQKLTSGSDAGLPVLAAQQDNLREALTFARAHDHQGLLRLATAMEQLWLAGNIAEGRRWLDESLAHPAAATLERARALHTAGLLANIQQAHSEARQLVEESLALSSSLNDELGESWARLTLGLIEFMAENADEATRHLERSLAMHEALGHRLGVSRSLTFLGATMTLIPSSAVQAREDLKRAQQTAHALTDSWGEGFALYFLGLADLDAGEHKPAATHLCGALRTEALGPIRAGALEGLAQLANEHDPRRAMRLLGAANSLRERHAGRPPPFIRRRAAAIRAHAEQRIDAAAAEQAWNDGRQMTTEEALAYALGDHQPRHDLQPQDIETTSAS
jgi:predicted ATPase/DNA-binding SARP family transcriptional activator